jgi:hypothetical protein
MTRYFGKKLTLVVSGCKQLSFSKTDFCKAAAPLGLCSLFSWSYWGQGRGRNVNPHHVDILDKKLTLHLSKELPPGLLRG